MGGRQGLVVLLHLRAEAETGADVWYLAFTGVYLWQYIATGKYTPMHNWLHQPLVTPHVYELAAVLIFSLIVAAILTRQIGEPIWALPDYGGIFLAAAAAFIGWLWYKVEIHAKPVVTTVVQQPQPTVTVTAGHPVTTTVVHTGTNWELVALFGIGGVIAVVILYLVVRFIL